MRRNGKLDYLPCQLDAVKLLYIWARLQSGKATEKKIHSKVLMLYRLDKKESNVLFISDHVSSSQSFLSFMISFSIFFFEGFFGKNCPERRRLEENRFHSVILRHHVNASILFLTTSINCRSYSPTRSTFLLEREAELLRLKWDEECSKRCCSCPLLTPSPPVFFSSDANPNLLPFTQTYRGTQTSNVKQPKHLMITDDLCRWDTRS